MAAQISRYSALIIAASMLASGSPTSASPNLNAVIEVGSKGVKATVFKIDPEELRHTIGNQGESDARFLLLNQAIYRRFSEIETSAILREGAEQTIAAVLEFENVIRRDFGASSTFIVASSGATRAPNFAELKSRIEDATHLKLDVLDAAQECSLTFRWIVPRIHRQDAVLVDIGSGNTKGCYEEASGPLGKRMHAFELLPFGTVNFARYAADRLPLAPGQELDTQKARSVRDAVLIPAIRRMRDVHVGLLSKRTLYLSGGAAWMLAAATHPTSANSNWTRLLQGDLAMWKNRIESSTECPNDPTKNTPLIDPNLTAEALRTCEVFNREQRVAAYSIVSAINMELRALCDYPDCKNMVAFAGVARDAWRNEYFIEKLLNLPRQ